MKRKSYSQSYEEYYQRPCWEIQGASGCQPPLQSETFKILTLCHSMLDCKEAASPWPGVGPHLCPDGQSHQDSTQWEKKMGCSSRKRVGASLMA